MKIGVLHGPNLNLLGTRETHVYGTLTLMEIDERIRARAAELDVEILDAFQSNSEGAIVDWIQAMRDRVDGLLVNPAAFTHTSVAIRDALLAVGIPFVELHLSNVHAREAFRHQSYFSDIAVGKIAGFGAASYLLALDGLVSHLRPRLGA